MPVKTGDFPMKGQVSSDLRYHKFLGIVAKVSNRIVEGFRIVVTTV